MTRRQRARAWIVALAAIAAVGTNAMGSSTVVAAPPGDGPPLEQPSERIDPGPDVVDDPGPDVVDGPGGDPGDDPELVDAASTEPEPTLPSWDSAPEAEPLVPPEPAPAAPPDGNGSITSGSILFGGGLVLTATSVVLLYEDDPAQAGVWIAGATIGSVAFATGVGLLASGIGKQHRYEPWAAEHAPPRRGTGLRAGGTTSLVGGGIALVFGGISLGRQSDDDLPYGEVLLGLGSVAVATGVVLLVFGGKRQAAFRAWERARLSPTVALLGDPRAHADRKPSGVSVGIAGRF